ncbi:MAG: flavodoxin family protein [Candidatus Altiarchaeota archaeon]|nr:flavodoxin family protein [Candidatus Altiarchaeota archaeon]
MKVVGLSGTHRKDGNTTILVKKALDVCRQKGAETLLIELSDKRIEYCTDCGSCVEKNGYACPVVDDVPEILAALESADAVIIGSPTYFGSLSGKLKALFDRTLPLRRNNFRLSCKVGGAIAVGGSRNGGQENVIRDIHNWMLIHEMIVVGDKKTAHFGGIAVARKPGDASSDVTGMRSAENLGMQVYEVSSRL